MSGPRYSIVPGDAVTDRKLREVHLRVLLVLGRRTNRYGWCRANQSAVGDLLGFKRETVSRAISVLVKHGYVEKRRDVKKGRVEYWYRVRMDRGEPETAAEDGPKKQGKQPDPALDVCDPPVTESVIADDHTPCDPPVTESVIARDHNPCDPQGSHVTTLIERPSKNHTHTLRSLTESVSCVCEELNPELENLIERGADETAVRWLLGPLTNALQRRDDQDGPFLLELAKQMAAYSPAVLEATALKIIRKRTKFPSIAQCVQVADEIAPKHVIKIYRDKDPAEWAAWLAVEQTKTPGRKAFMATRDSWSVPSPFPPAGGGAGS